MAELGRPFCLDDNGRDPFYGKGKRYDRACRWRECRTRPIELRLAASPYIAQVVVVGQDRKSLAALIVPHKDRVAEELTKVGHTAPEAMTEWDSDPHVREFFHELIKHSISAQNGFKAFEKVTHFAILGKEFEKGREMTETMKIKRNVVYDMYAGVMDRIRRRSFLICFTEFSSVEKYPDSRRIRRRI